MKFLTTHQERISGLYRDIEKMRARCVTKRNAVGKHLPHAVQLQRVMLAGKVKAYTDCLNLIKGKFGKVLKLDVRKRVNVLPPLPPPI